MIKQIFQTIPGTPMFLRKNVIIGPNRERNRVRLGCLNEGTFFPSADQDIPRINRMLFTETQSSHTVA